MASCDYVLPILWTLNNDKCIPSIIGNATDDGALLRGGALCWVSLRCGLPWEDGASPADEEAGADDVAGRLRENTGASAPRHVLKMIWRREQDYKRVVFWAGLLTALVVAVHLEPSGLGAALRGKQLRGALRAAETGHTVIVMGDMNCRLKRGEKGSGVFILRMIKEDSN